MRSARKTCKEGFRGFACREVVIKAMPVVEPQRLSNLAGRMPPQLDILKMAFPSQRMPQCLPEGGLKKIVRLCRPGAIMQLIGAIPTLYSFCNYFLDFHKSLLPPQHFCLLYILFYMVCICIVLQFYILCTLGSEDCNRKAMRSIVENVYRLFVIDVLFIWLGQES